MIKEIANLIKENGGRAYFVGGFVRDFLLNKKSADIDIEVFGISKEKLESILLLFGNVDSIGKDYGVFKLNGIDFAIARKEKKTGKLHKDFLVIPNPNLKIKKAEKRRDFTINSIMQDVLTGEIIDKFNGRKDLQNKILRATNYKTFADDELRILRCAEFKARFDFAVDGKTKKLCTKNGIENLTAFRIKEELKKVFLFSKKPSIFFEFLRETHNTNKWFNELFSLTKKDYLHTLKSLDNLAKTKIEKEEKQEKMLNCLIEFFANKKEFLLKLEYDKKTIKKLIEN
ncbi:MAG: hypothetical protein MJ066_00430 [Clostridia bacterium]|nr:hypothetical protein [Clostridia bacterium]